jgi:hypothetical protein
MPPDNPSASGLLQVEKRSLTMNTPEPENTAQLQPKPDDKEALRLWEEMLFFNPTGQIQPGQQALSRSVPLTSTRNIQ